MTTGTFLAVFLPVAFFCTGLLFTLLLLYLRDADKTLGRIENTLKPVDELMSWMRQIGLEELLRQRYMGKSNPHPLEPGEQELRDSLLQKAGKMELEAWEAEELQGLLRREAESDFARGVIGILAFVGAIAVIKAIGDYLQRPRIGP